MPIRVFTAILLAGSAVLPARAACTPPSPPDASARPSKPALPAKGPCVGAATGTPGCLGWEAYTYNDEVKAYNEKAAVFQKAAQAYVERLNAYVKASGEFAQCEVKALQ